MSTQNPDQTRLALASLFACTAVALDKNDGEFLPRFEDALKEAWYHLRDNTQHPVNNAGAMETLTWTREMIAIVKSKA